MNASLSFICHNCNDAELCFGRPRCWHDRSRCGQPVRGRQSAPSNRSAAILAGSRLRCTFKTRYTYNAMSCNAIQHFTFCSISNKTPFKRPSSSTKKADSASRVSTKASRAPWLATAPGTWSTLASITTLKHLYRKLRFACSHNLLLLFQCIAQKSKTSVCFIFRAKQLIISTEAWSDSLVNLTFNYIFMYYIFSNDFILIV